MNLPRQPYASDNLEQDGIWRQSQRDAIRCKHIQHNGDLVTWLTFDCDYDATAFSHRDVLVPPPNIITLNPDNGRGHLSYRLLAPVAKTDAARDRPLRYLAAIETGMTRRLDADPGCAGLVTKKTADWSISNHRHARPRVPTERAGGTPPCRQHAPSPIRRRCRTRAQLYGV